jgi:translation initiation factor IF-1
MRPIALPLVVTLAAAGLAGVHAPAVLAYANPSTAAKPSSTRVAGEVVSTEGNKLVLKTASGEEETFTVAGKAATQMSTFKTGDRVVVKARNTEALSISAEGKSKSTTKSK